MRFDTSLRPPDLAGEPRVAVRIRRRLLSRDEPVFKTRLERPIGPILRALPFESGSHDRRHELVPVRVLV